MFCTKTWSLNFTFTQQQLRVLEFLVEIIEQEFAADKLISQKKVLTKETMHMKCIHALYLQQLIWMNYSV